MTENCAHLSREEPRKVDLGHHLAAPIPLFLILAIMRLYLEKKHLFFITIFNTVPKIMLCMPTSISADIFLLT